MPPNPTKINIIVIKKSVVEVYKKIPNPIKGQRVNTKKKMTGAEDMAQRSCACLSV